VLKLGLLPMLLIESVVCLTCAPLPSPHVDSTPLHVALPTCIHSLLHLHAALPCLPTRTPQVKAGMAHAYLGDMTAAAEAFNAVLQVCPPPLLSACQQQQGSDWVLDFPASSHYVLWLRLRRMRASTAATPAPRPCPLQHPHIHPHTPSCTLVISPTSTPTPLLQEQVDSFADLYQEAGAVMMDVGQPEKALPFLRWGCTTQRSCEHCRVAS